VRRVAAALSLTLVLGACSSGVLVDAYPREDGTDELCDMLLADLPPTVAGQERREVAQDVPAAAWGEVPVILRCGTERPEDLVATSRCDVVEDVGWFDEETAGGRLFTTIGRAAYVSVEVPPPLQPAADVLVDLAESIVKHVPEEQPCV
jgi:hypothetical protein